MIVRSAHHIGVTPSVWLTWRSSMNIVLVSSIGTTHRLIIGPLNPCSRRPSSQIGATCCRFGRTASTIRAQTFCPTRRVPMYIMPTGVSTNSSSGNTPNSELGTADNRVEKRRMGGIHGVLHGLQPVARIEIFRARHQPIAWPDKAVVHREGRLLVGRTHIGKDDAAVL